MKKVVEFLQANPVQYVVLFNALPFNELKGLVIGIFTMLVYKRLTPVLKRVR